MNRFKEFTLIPVLAKSLATLRFFGDDLDPEQISTVLGTKPTDSRYKGEVCASPSGKQRSANKGFWRLQAPACEPGNLEWQIEWLFQQTTTNLGVWRHLTGQFESDVFCGIFMNELNEGFSLSPTSLAALGGRGLKLGLDLYGAGDISED